MNVTRWEARNQLGLEWRSLARHCASTLTPRGCFKNDKVFLTFYQLTLDFIKYRIYP